MTVVTEDWNSTTTLTVRGTGTAVVTEGWNSTTTWTDSESEMVL